VIVMMLERDGSSPVRFRTALFGRAPLLRPLSPVSLL